MALIIFDFIGIHPNLGMIMLFSRTIQGNERFLVSAVVIPFLLHPWYVVKHSNGPDPIFSLSTSKIIQSRSLPLWVWEKFKKSGRLNTRLVRQPIRFFVFPGRSLSIVFP